MDSRLQSGNEGGRRGRHCCGFRGATEAIKPHVVERLLVELGAFEDLVLTQDLAELRIHVDEHKEEELVVRDDVGTELRLALTDIRREVAVRPRALLELVECAVTCPSKIKIAREGTAEKLLAERHKGETKEDGAAGTTTLEEGRIQEGRELA